MKKWLKKHFVPHEGNQFRPHFWRPKSVSVTVLVLVMGFSVFAAGLRLIPKLPNFAAIYTETLIYYTNQAREQYQEPDFVPNETLTEAAQMKADDMAAKGYFAHNSPDGKTPWYWISKAGYVYKYAGENLAVNFTDSKEVTDAWMESPTHRANILNKDLKEIGIATAQGMYEGREAIFVVQMFGTPAEVTTATVMAEREQTTVSVPPKPVVAKSQSAPKPTQPVVTSVPEAKEVVVAGAYENTVKPTDKLLASPATSVETLYKYFIILIVLLVSFAGLYESKRHHKSIWISALVLVVASGMLAFLVHYLSPGAILG